MRATLSHNLDPAELATVLAGTALRERVDGDVADILKSHADAELRLPTEPHLLQMVMRLKHRYQAAVDHLAAHLQAWIDHAVAGGGSWDIKKALPGAQLTPEQLVELASLIRAHFRPVGVGFEDPRWNIPEEYWQRWQALGIVPHGMPVPEFADAYLAGRLYQVIAEGDDYAAMLRLAATLPKTRAMQIGADWAASHAAEYVTKFGAKLADEATGEALSVNQRIARELIGRYMDGTLKVARAAEGPAKDLTVAERQALESDKVVQDWRTLARELYKTFKGTEKARDWMRLAASETRLAYNVGRIDAMLEAGHLKMYYLVRDTACPDCRRVYLEKDGTPRVFDIGEVAMNVANGGGLNVGKPRAEWVATGLLHPWCRCVPVALMKGQKPTGPVK